MPAAKEVNAILHAGKIDTSPGVRLCEPLGSNPSAKMPPAVDPRGSQGLTPGLASMCQFSPLAVDNFQLIIANGKYFDFSSSPLFTLPVRAIPAPCPQKPPVDTAL